MASRRGVLGKPPAPPARGRSAGLKVAASSPSGQAQGNGGRGRPHWPVPAMQAVVRIREAVVGVLGKPSSASGKAPAAGASWPCRGRCRRRPVTQQPPGRAANGLGNNRSDGRGGRRAALRPRPFGAGPSSLSPRLSSSGSSGSGSSAASARDGPAGFPAPETVVALGAACQVDPRAGGRGEPCRKGKTKNRTIGAFKQRMRQSRSRSGPGRARRGRSRRAAQDGQRRGLPGSVRRSSVADLENEGETAADRGPARRGRLRPTSTWMSKDARWSRWSARPSASSSVPRGEILEALQE